MFILQSIKMVFELRIFFKRPYLLGIYTEVFTCEMISGI